MSIEITLVTDLALRQLVGPGAAATLAEAGLPRPDDLCALAREDGFVACLGQEQYLIAGLDRPSLPAGTLPWCFMRSDSVFRLSAERSLDLLAQLCGHDLRRLPEAGWLMTRVAGIDVWLYAGTRSHDSVLIGCEASYERYLHDALDATVPTTAPAQHA